MINEFEMKALLHSLNKEGFEDIEIKPVFSKIFQRTVHHLKFNFQNYFFYFGSTTDLYNRVDLSEFLLKEFKSIVTDFKNSNKSVHFKKSFIEQQIFYLSGFKNETSLCFSYCENGYEEFINSLVSKYSTTEVFLEDLDNIDAQEILAHGYEILGGGV